MTPQQTQHPCDNVAMQCSGPTPPETGCCPQELEGIVASADTFPDLGDYDEEDWEVQLYTLAHLFRHKHSHSLSNLHTHIILSGFQKVSLMGAACIYLCQYSEWSAPFIQAEDSDEDGHMPVPPRELELDINALPGAQRTHALCYAHVCQSY